jgi:hypothetical protein
MTDLPYAADAEAPLSTEELNVISIIHRNIVLIFDHVRI